MNKGDLVQLSDGRTGYYQGTEGGRVVVLVREVLSFESKDVKPHKEWKGEKKGGL